MSRLKTIVQTGLGVGLAGFLATSTLADDKPDCICPPKISRAAYADMFGPTTGDKVRLADTELFIEVEKDFTTYGEEVKFGGGKVIRDGMGQSRSRAPMAPSTP
jgi:hypothetical protein